MTEKKGRGRPRGDKQTEVIRVDVKRWSMLKRIERLDQYDYAEVVQLMYGLDAKQKLND